MGEKFEDVKSVFNLALLFSFDKKRFLRSLVNPFETLDVSEEPCQFYLALGKGTLSWDISFFF